MTTAANDHGPAPPFPYLGTKFRLGTEHIRGGGTTVFTVVHQSTEKNLEHHLCSVAEKDVTINL